MNTSVLLLAWITLLGPLQNVQAQNYNDWVMQIDATEWLKERVEKAKNGKPELLEIPLVVRSTGWGDMYPSYIMGSISKFQNVPVVAPFGKKLPEPDIDGHLFIAKGKFTGKFIEIDLRNDSGEPEEWLYVIPEFRITKLNPVMSGKEMPAPRIL